MIPEQVKAVLRAFPVIMYVRAADSHGMYVNIRSGLARTPSVLFSKSVADLLRAPANEEVRGRPARRFAVIEVAGEADIDKDNLKKLVGLRFTDLAFAGSVILVGDKPGSEMISADLQHMVMPVDLAASEKDGSDWRARLAPMTETQIEEEFLCMYKHVTDRPLDKPIPSLVPFAGLDRVEVRHALALAIIAAHATASLTSFLASPANFVVPFIIDSVRHRWGRIA